MFNYLKWQVEDSEPLHSDAKLQVYTDEHVFLYLTVKFIQKSCSIMNLQLCYFQNDEFYFIHS